MSTFRGVHGLSSTGSPGLWPESITTDIGRLGDDLDVLAPASFPISLRKKVDERLRASGGISRGGAGAEGVGGCTLISRLFVGEGESTVSTMRGSVDFAFRSGVWVRKSEENDKSRKDTTE